MLYDAGRDNSLDNGIFIHVIVTRHMESVAFLNHAEGQTG